MVPVKSLCTSAFGLELYDENVLDETYNLIEKWSFSDVNKFYIDVRKDGLKAYDPNGKYLQNFEKIFRFIYFWSKNRKIFQNNEDESIFLSPLKKY